MSYVLHFALFAAAAQAGPLLFHASLERSTTADFAAGDGRPIVAQAIEHDAAARFVPNSRLTYDARANLYAEQGTVAFWWRPDQPLGRLGFPLFIASYEQHSTWDYNFARIDWTGSGMSARVHDRNLEYHTVRAEIVPQVGRWMHVALTWSEPGGVTLFLDGKRVAHALGPLALDARLDQFGFLTNAVTPHHTAPSENAGSIKQARIYGAALADADIARLASGGEPGEPGRAPVDWAARFGWNDTVPRAAALVVKRIPVRQAKDLGKFWLKGVDGKRETLWPMQSHGYRDEGKVYRVWPEAEPVNFLRTTGNLAARFTAQGVDFTRPGERELHYYALPKTAPLELLTIERQAGMLGDLEFLRIEKRASAAAGKWITFAPAASDGFQGRRDPATFTVWKPGAAGANAPRGARYHYYTIPAESEVSLAAVRLRIAGAAGAYYTAAVEDPVNVSRDLIEADVRAVAATTDLTLEFPATIVPAGRQVVVRLSSSSEAPLRVEAQLVTTDAAAGRERHIASRVLQIRDSFQMLSEARPWMMLGTRQTLPNLRRQLKLVDELYTLLEDVRRVDPAQPVANGYWSWINRAERPPEFKDTAPVDPAVPEWARGQLRLVAQFRQVVDWWIDNRQIETGEMGGGLGDDTDMIQNWPAVAFLDGPAGKIKDSVRKVLEACYAQGMVANGMNTHRTDALHAYEEGMNAYGPAFLLDYGNPVLFERMLETASHYPRLTGVNAAGHRHFRSYQYSATDVVEEGYHAREDIYSHLILHPGLYVAWYNGLPAVTGLLKEYADSLLAHWRTERYPNLAKGIFFADDRVENRSSPNTETFNLLWGIYDITRDPKYLWLVREAVKAGDFSRAGSVNGPWLNAVETADAAPALAREAERRNIHDHNLQTDQQGVVARVLAWQAGGDLKLVEDAHSALVQHMAQNMYLYTEAEQFTDRIWIPTLSVQRERLGGVAHNRNHIYPGHAVSWEDTGAEVAALVPVARPDALRIIAFNAGSRARRAMARVWQLENGTYEVAMREEGGPARTTKLRLKRYSPVGLDLPSKKIVTIEFRQLEKGTPLSQLPDLAIAPEEARENQGLEIPVHNIGAAPSGAFRVTVSDDNGKLLAESAHEGLSAPLDLKPRLAVVRFPSVHLRAGLKIRVERQGNGEEISEENNEVTVPSPTR